MNTEKNNERIPASSLASSENQAGSGKSQSEELYNPLKAVQTAAPVTSLRVNFSQDESDNITSEKKDG